MSDAPVAGVKPAGRSRAGAALGKYTKSATPPDIRAKLQGDRSTRYELLASARALFLFEGKREGLKHPHDWHRTAKCKWVTVSSAVGVHASREHGSGFYSGLMTCGNVWTCTVCAAKVQERRREEIAAAIAWAYKQGLQPVMVTLTFPHQHWHKLSDLIEQQADALHRLRAGAPWSRFKKSVGYWGLIRSLELTFGDSGWHPHTHEIWFVSRDAVADLSTAEAREHEVAKRKKLKLSTDLDDVQDMRSRITERWKACCARAGLLDLDNARQVAGFEAHAVDVKGWCDASDYLAKQDDSRHWGVDREVAKASTKAGKAKGKHPFGLLAQASVGDKQSGARFIEYASVMRGKRQLFWSAGLKAKVGIGEATDEELAEQQRDAADLLGMLDLDDWRLIREAGKRADVLDAAESNGGWAAVLHLVRSIKARLAPVLAPSACWDKPQRRRSAMQQVVVLSDDEKMLFAQVGKVLYGQPFQEKTREIVGSAPAPRVDEEMVYRVAERDMPTHVWPAFQMMRSRGYAENSKDRDPDQEGEVMLVDGSLLDLVMEALKRVVEALLGVGGSSGSPPAGRSLKARRSRQSSLLLEHDSAR